MSHTNRNGSQGGGQVKAPLSSSGGQLRVASSSGGGHKVAGN